MRKISFHNGLGQIVTYSLVAEFTDDDGRVFYVYGPLYRGMYDPRTPYDIMQKGSGEWTHEHD